jgi:hypothetical protein
MHAVSIKNVYVRELSYHTATKVYKFKGATNNGTACTIFESENRSYLGEFEAEFKKAEARESGAKGGIA